MIWLLKFPLAYKNNDIKLRDHWVLHLLGLDPDKTVLPTSLEDVGWEMKDIWNTIWPSTDFKSKVSSTSISILEVYWPSVVHITCFLIRLLAAVEFFCLYISMFCGPCFNSYSCRKTPELQLWPSRWSPMLWDRNQKPQRFLNWRRSLAAKDFWSTDDPSPPGETTLIRSSDRLHLCSLISPQRHTKRKYTYKNTHTQTIGHKHIHTHDDTLQIIESMSGLVTDRSQFGGNLLDFLLPGGSFMLSIEF